MAGDTKTCSRSSAPKHNVCDLLFLLVVLVSDYDELHRAHVVVSPPPTVTNVFSDSDVETLVIGPPNHNDHIDMTGDDNGDTDPGEDNCDTCQGDGPDDDNNDRKVSHTQANCTTL